MRIILKIIKTDNKQNRGKNQRKSGSITKSVIIINISH